jgi:hypothetical protein
MQSLAAADHPEPPGGQHLQYLKKLHNWVK